MQQGVDSLLPLFGTLLCGVVPFACSQIADADTAGVDPRFGTKEQVAAGGRAPTLQEITHFIWDRTRSIRKDFNIQVCVCVHVCVCVCACCTTSKPPVSLTLS